MNINEWNTQLEEWRRIYGVPKPTITQFNPSSVTTICKKCCKYRPNRMTRHHKMSDFFFACLRPDLYAKRYLEFRSEDVDKLCDYCHEKWHTLLKPIMRKLYEEVKRIKAKGRAPTQKWCEDKRRFILRRYNKWLAYKLKDKG